METFACHCPSRNATQAAPRDPLASALIDAALAADAALGEAPPPSQRRLLARLVSSAVGLLLVAHADEVTVTGAGRELVRDWLCVGFPVRPGAAIRLRLEALDRDPHRAACGRIGRPDL